ncbi:MAG: peptidylprolyl isomerase, partial [Terriglobales bacterium]
DANSPDCKTVVTKAAFEKLVNILNPKMPGATRENLANDYAKMIVLSHDAKKRGVENTERYKELVRFATMQLASQELFHMMQEESKPTEAEVDKYYHDHLPKFEEISLKRIFIPRNRADAKAEDKMPTDEDLQAEGEKLKARLHGGEDFDKVQKEVYTSKGYEAPPPPTNISGWRAESLPPDQKSLAELKQGELSPVMVEAAGAYIYRLEEKKTAPLETVKPGIEAELSKEALNAKMQALLSSIKPELNNAYFHPPAPPAAPAEGVVAPPGAPEGPEPIRPMANTSSEPHSTTAEPATPKK